MRLSFERLPDLIPASWVYLHQVGSDRDVPRAANADRFGNGFNSVEWAAAPDSAPSAAAPVLCRAAESGFTATRLKSVRCSIVISVTFVEPSMTNVTDLPNTRFPETARNVS